ncbi:zinc-binding dehydrogenase [Paenibacillus sp. LMG 31458]|uniref:Zinc-binding dehydrogenase n=1 Tax=Paenibacillus phytorum TaxID=2654977 RepID=A0ABX1Y4B8_9BACL|nr:NADP-dependent oxidoreductase [Paenibacillus phytorum]NOU75732.1 zinc-binding dehydrogenase [Paenibacillus phytorum]
MSIQNIKVIRVHQYGGPEQLKLEQVECPKPSVGEVLIRVHAVGVLPTDCKIRSGMLKDFFSVDFPYIPGSSIAGVIEEIGPDVTGFKKGQAVFGQSTKGAYAEYITTSVERLALKPDGISFDEAVTIHGGAGSAWAVLFDNAKLQEGQRVLIHGAAGGVGLFATQLAKWKGAHVIGTASTANVDFVRSLGADTVIDYTTTPFEEVVQDVDLVIDSIGGDTLERSWSVLKRGGTILSLVTHPSQEKAQELSVRAEHNIARPNREALRTIAQLMADGKIKTFISKTFTLDEAPQAHELCQYGHVRGRIVFHIAD